MVHPIKAGEVERMSFSKIREILEMPDLIEIQKKSYEWFLEKGLREVLDDISPIVDYSGELILEFLDYSLYGEPKYDMEECKERDSNYSRSLRVKVRLTFKETNVKIEQDVYLGDFPIMTDKGTFIINGAERVIVSQLVRSPGAYFFYELDKAGKELYSSQIIPSRGAWLEFETDSNDIMYVRVDRTRKLPVTILMRMFGLGTNAEIIEYFSEDKKILATLEKDSTSSKEEGLIEIYKRLRPGEPPTVDNAKSLTDSMFFDNRRYDLAVVGRYKINKKLALATRIASNIAANNIISPKTGEIFVSKGEVIKMDVAKKIQNSGINRVDVVVIKDKEERKFTVIGNNTVNILEQDLPFDISDIDIEKMVRYDVLCEILSSDKSEEEMKQELKDRIRQLVPKHITIEDIFCTINYNMGLEYGIGDTDDIDHLGNRRLRSVGELLQNQFRIGLTRMEKNVKERMMTPEKESLTPQDLVNIRPVHAAIKEFFGSSQLSQFMDQTNPLAELTNRRRLSALGPGGLSRDRAGFEVRDVHYSHYGRMCPIETPEGPNIGLINSLCTYARVNDYGFIETPYRKVENGRVTEINEYLTADEEGFYTIAQANEPLDDNGNFINSKVTGRTGKERAFVMVEPNKIDYMDISPKQIVSVATALIPFLENDDANRALMGSNMQRQAVPLLNPQSPIIGTGMEHISAKDSGVCVVAQQDGIVEKVASNRIVVSGRNYPLLKFKRTNQGTCCDQRPIVDKGDVIKKGDIIADGPSTEKGELALGRNVLVGFMTWEGYNFEDAILISEKLVKEDAFTSIHIEEYECEARETKLGPEEITRDIPNVGEDVLKNLNEKGIIRIGAEVTSDDILVGKVTPKGEKELTAEERLLRAIFGEKAREVRDTSLKVPHGESGIVVDVKEFSRENGDELKPQTNKTVRVYVAVKRKISVGDKMAGRHGNKGVVSRILPEEDMPFMEDGTPLEIVLNPLGVPSRMNIGQVLETHLGMAAAAFGWKIATPVFDGANEDDTMDLLEKAGYNKDGKVKLYDGRTGDEFDNRVTVGYMYILKLAHLVDDKIHARSTGPYSLVTQQPLGGKAQFGGQRFGEMEVWALEAYGSAHTLQEILTVKSDDVVGRVKTYEAIVKGENIPEPGIPESFKVLIKELQALCLDVKVLNDEKEEIEIKESVEEEVFTEITGISIDSP
ncbi:MAG: DNA-directed RNA polymerase subunit beta, partial [Eubacteriaceae bacterium]